MTMKKRILSLTTATLIGVSLSTTPAAHAALPSDASLSIDDEYGVPGSEQFMPLLEIPILGPILYYTIALPVGMFIIGMYNLQNQMS